jgi:hypothetical protein
MSSFGFVRLVVRFYPTSGGTSAPMFRVMEFVQLETVLSVKRRDSIVHGVRTHRGREPSFEGADRFLVGFDNRIRGNRGVVSLNHSNILLTRKFLIVEGREFDLKLSPINASVRSKHTETHFLIMPVQ